MIEIHIEPFVIKIQTPHNDFCSFTFNILYDWCDKNCKGYFQQDNYMFLFELESDAMAFKLRWT